MLASVAVIAALRWVDPPISSFMLQQRFAQPKLALHQKWIDYQEITPVLALAVIASEDQKFPYHWGFDFQAIHRALKQNWNGGSIRGASTITQQVAKNLFLWPGQSYVRKGLEAYLAILIELFWPKQRILEVYLNIAEMGRGIYGVSAASRVFFQRPPAALSREQAALLAAVLPNPKELKVSAPSTYVRQRQRWILNQMRALGGVTYVESL